MGSVIKLYFICKNYITINIIETLISIKSKYVNLDLTIEEAKQDIFECIEVFYNRKRLHSTNDYWSPVDYEEMQKAV